MADLKFGSFILKQFGKDLYLLYLSWRVSNESGVLVFTSRKNLRCNQSCIEYKKFKKQLKWIDIQLKLLPFFVILKALIDLIYNTQNAQLQTATHYAQKEALKYIEHILWGYFSS